MPKNRHTRSREEKTEELVTIALRLFLEKGYDGTTMASIGAEAGIATNVVHWYFPTKDQLFVAALESYQSESLKELMERPVESHPDADDRQLLAERITGLVWRLVGISSLIAAVHQKSHDSSIVAEFREKTQKRHADYIREAVDRCHVPKAEKKLVVEVLISAFEGLVMHRASETKTKRTMTFLVEKLTAGAPDKYAGSTIS
ncbi:MAG: TetR/AcrR family transcriptional regulator [Gammaproteobacteria bacterium]|nr:TetR/AcrR family transcriptional regulator [Gammaproteobacteria bacterium]